MSLRKIIFLLFFYSLFQQVYSQFVSASIGASIPSGSYGSKDINNSSAAFALSGLIYQVSFANKPKDYFMGISALIRHQSNDLDSKGFANGLAIKYPGIVWTANSTAWNSNFFMIGTYSPFLLDSGRTSIYFKFMFGAASCTLPEISISGQQGSAGYWKKTSGSTSVSAAYLIGIGFKYNLNYHLCLLVDIDYLGTKPEFKNVKSYDSNSIERITTLSQSISTYNVGIGIGIKL
jgi:hypothetical protein